MKDKRIFGLIPTLFFLTGFSSLLYEIIWLKKLGLVLGVTVYALTAVLAAFMMGLGGGSIVIGRLAKRTKHPLRWYGLIEAAIAVLALLSPHLINLLVPLNGALFRSLGSSGLLSGLALFATAFLLLLPATFLMGGTFPLLMRLYAGEERKRGLPLLYGINTAGAFAGSYMTGMYLIGTWGIHESLYLGCSISLLAGIVAIAADRAIGVEEDETAPAAFALRYHPLLLLTAVTGFTSMAGEILWTRLLEYHIGSMTYAFTAVLCTYLVGIAAGSLVAPVLARKASTVYPLLIRLVVTMILFTVLGLVFYANFDRLEFLVLMGKSLKGVIFLAYFLPVFFLVFPTSFISGLLFALGGAAYIGDETREWDTGCFLGMNTVGAVLGTVLTSFVLIPAAGTAPSIVLVMLLHVPVLLTLLAVAGAKTAARIRVVGAAAVILAGGLYLSHDFLLSVKWADAEVLFFHEGPGTTVTITREHEPAGPFMRMFQNRHSLTATSMKSRRYMNMLGHLPALIHEGPRDVLVIALGTGLTLGSFGHHRSIRTIDCVELVEGVLLALPIFDEVNGRIREDERVTFVVTDGRNYLAAAEKSYDIITAEPPPPRSVGAVNLYSAEFYELCRHRLNRGGLVVQWVPLHSSTEGEFRMLIRTFLEAFPHVEGFLPVPDELILIGSESPIPLDSAVLAGRMRRAGVGTALADIGFRSVDDVLGTYYGSRETLAAYCGEGKIIRDAYPWIAYPEWARTWADREGFWDSRDRARFFFP